MSEPSRTDRYMARVEQHLLTFPRLSDKIGFLDTQIERWDRESERFEETEGRSHPGATAFDFAETTAALCALRGRLTQRSAA